MTATPSMVRPSAFYFSIHGEWTFEVEQIQGSFVYYTVVETKQKCKTTIDDFCERVEPAERK